MCRECDLIGKARAYLGDGVRWIERGYCGVYGGLHQVAFSLVSGGIVGPVQLCGQPVKRSEPGEALGKWLDSFGRARFGLCGEVGCVNIT